LSFLDTIALVKSMAVSGVEEASRLDLFRRPFQQPLHSSSVRHSRQLHTTSTGRLINQPNPEAN
jgi:hypothetical protein